MEALDVTEIIKYLPHRYPFLLIDRVTDYQPGSSLSALKNISINEPIFTGHFPQFPVFPGVLILEAMAQSCAVYAFRELGGYPSEETLYLLVGIDQARFKKQVLPGDQLKLHVNLQKTRRGIWQFDGTGHVDDKLCCSAKILIAKNEIER